MQSSGWSVYWLKRDFRLEDNRALSAALAESERVCAIYILEDWFLNAAETSHFHLDAVFSALKHLHESIESRGGTLLVMKGRAENILPELHRQFPFENMYSHQEHGARASFDRDKKIKSWCAGAGVHWHEFRQSGVFRGLKNRDQRQRLWQKFTFEPLLPEPQGLHRLAVPETWQTNSNLIALQPESFDLSSPGQPLWQEVNEAAAKATLTDFLTSRGLLYRGGISSPNTAFEAGSRLSVHFAWGTLTSRSAYQRTVQRMRELKESSDPQAGRWRSSVRNFLSRLHWRDHFIQRLEDEPQMEFTPLNVAYEQLEYENDPGLLEAWQNGYTGWPMVDACMRCLNATGFINFRMRAMLTSVACHALHLDWRLIHPHLAGVFRDYEPGIHFSQLQMQASVVGINTVRVYSPQKQLLDQDPELKFVRRWVPELREKNNTAILAHYKLPTAGYPAPVVNWKHRTAIMKDRIFRIRKQEKTRELAARVYEKHGSRKRGRSGRNQ